MNWTDNRTKKLIDALKEHKILYYEYRNISARNNAYEKILNTMDPKYFNIEEIKKKLNELAMDVMVETEMDETANESGADTTPKKGAKNKKLYKEMEFIKDSPKPKLSSSIIGEPCSPDLKQGEDNKEIIKSMKFIQDTSMPVHSSSIIKEAPLPDGTIKLEGCPKCIASENIKVKVENVRFDLELTLKMANVEIKTNREEK